MITNAKDQSLFANPGTLPDVSGALLNWFQRLYFTKIEKTIVDFDLVESEQEYSAMGVRQPMSAQKLSMKPEGQRAWKWETIHALPDTILAPDEIIKFLNVRYRVMEKLDWKEYGFVEYHIIEDFVGFVK